MTDAPPRLCILTGMGRVGKSTTVDLLAPLLPATWRPMHLDDFCGAAFVGRDGATWEAARGPHFRLAGASAGFYLGRTWSVLIEGNFRYRADVDEFLVGVRGEFPAPRSPEVLLLADDPAAVAERAVGDPAWAPELTGDERRRDLFGWIPGSAPEADVAERSVDVRRLGRAEVARRVAAAFELPV